jgi:ribonuclease HI
MKIKIYADGACSGNPGPSGCGVYLQYGDHTKEFSVYIGNQTNNIAELSAIKIALENLKVYYIPISIYTDSQYSIGVLSLGWKAKANVELIGKIKKLMDKFSDIEFIKVKGHSGDYGNEIVDKLAVKAYQPYI